MRGATLVSAVLDRYCMEQYNPFFDTKTIGEQLTSAVVDRYCIEQYKPFFDTVLRQ